ncbi:uncharacterized protein ARMOST_02628 [Armillaria ostoyae]|uniref:Uncharacterized protein n=1 Tax=Armillaria ostoyae TaxID=47428 RepID=A0A284QS84_ARMOS|nr:uncharacterized protein ARMOST_02628 [Armillaria ostoyae]
MFNVETNQNHKTTVSADHESGNRTKLDAHCAKFVKVLDLGFINPEGQSTQLTGGRRREFAKSTGRVSCFHDSSFAYAGSDLKKCAYPWKNEPLFLQASRWAPANQKSSRDEPTFVLSLVTRDKGWGDSQFRYGGLCTSALLKILTSENGLPVLPVFSIIQISFARRVFSRSRMTKH